ncbi:MAG: hypothetical protein ACHP7O_08370 [Burkholderiales bacterium]
MIFLPLLLAREPVFADNIAQAVPRSPTDQNALGRSVPRMDYLRERIVDIKENPEISERVFPNAVFNVKNQGAPSTASPSIGIHMRMDEQRPGFEYRFSNEGTIRLHLGKHGSSAVAGWNF